jgi:Asp-tRNA(Asn)/Glu-tRNA(Gln) amidotransferase A subunit family amidase
MTDHIPYDSATTLARQVRRGELSPVDIVETCLERIDTYDDEINAFVTVRADGAREDAIEREQAVEDGARLGPLHGVPVAIKDLADVKGIKTTYGSKLFADNVADGDATIVSRLREAGAIIIGKTNTPEFGRKPMTTNKLVGATGNPWDTTRTSGGSSGGSAAAVAAGMVPIAQGSDAAGSIRIPSSACGVYGLMPDFGRIPQGPSRADAFVNTHPYVFLGPITRTVQDAALMMDVVAGPHPRDPFSLPEPTEDYASAVAESTRDLSVAYSPDLGFCTVSEDVREVVADAVDTLKPAVSSVTVLDSVFEHTWDEFHDVIEVLLQERYAGMRENFKKDLDLDLLDHREDLTREVVSRLEKAEQLESLSVRRAERTRTEGYDVLQDVFEDNDVLVTPTIGMSPFEKDTQPTEIDGKEIDPLHGWALTWPLDLTGNPAASVPVGHTPDGLPVGLQVIGPRHGDRTVVTLSAALERVRPWRERYPPTDIA